MRFKEILDSIIAWGNNHPQIQYVNWGKIDELQNLASYPTMYITPTPGEFNTNQITNNFDIYFIDKQRHDNINNEDAFSSMQLLAVDLLNNFDIQWFHENGWYVELPAQFDYVDGDLEDYVGGIILSIRTVTTYDVNCLGAN